MDAEPVLQESKPISKVIFWLIGLLVVALILTGVVFLTNNTSPETSTTERETTTQQPAESNVQQVATDTSALITEIDNELTELDASLASTEDDTSDLTQ